jgi:hypothetical protein
MSVKTSKTGFFNVFAGGSGLLAAPPHHELDKADGHQVPHYNVALDTDTIDERLSKDGNVDACLPQGLERNEVTAVRASPASFGTTVKRIVHEVGGLITEEDFRNGARTVRPLAQLVFEFRRHALAASLNQCLRDFLHRGGCDCIVPVFVSSSAGGTGSTYTILLATGLQQKSFRSQMLRGLPDGLVTTPIAFIVEPFYRAYAHANDPTHTAKILGNAMAFRIESAELEKRGWFKNIYHLGLSSTGGAVLDSEREVARVLGTSLYQFEKHWAGHIKSRTVDTADVHAIFGRYRGHDTPEKMLTTPRSVRTAASVQGNGQPIAP